MKANTSITEMKHLRVPYRNSNDELQVGIAQFAKFFPDAE